MDINKISSLIVNLQKCKVGHRSVMSLINYRYDKNSLSIFASLTRCSLFIEKALRRR